MSNQSGHSSVGLQIRYYLAGLQSDFSTAIEHTAGLHNTRRLCFKCGQLNCNGWHTDTAVLIPIDEFDMFDSLRALQNALRHAFVTSRMFMKTGDNILCPNVMTFSVYRVLMDQMATMLSLNERVMTLIMSQQTRHPLIMSRGSTDQKSDLLGNPAEAYPVFCPDGFSYETPNTPPPLN